MIDHVKEKRKEVVQYLIRNDVLVTGEMLSLLNKEDVVSRVHTTLPTSPSTDYVLDLMKPEASTEQSESKHTKENTSRQQENTNQSSSSTGTTTTILRKAQEGQTASGERLGQKQKGTVRVVHEHHAIPRKITAQDFISHLNRRWKMIEQMLRQRQELKNVTAIGRLRSLPERSNIAIIGMILDKQETKNGNIMFTIEDPTGETRVVITQSDKDQFQLAQDTTLDEVVGIVGTTGAGIIFGQTLLTPDIPLGRETKTAPDDAHVAFISDFHIGSKLFMPETLQHFIDWTNGKVGNAKHKEIAQKLQYIFIIGDLVTSVGVYPNQENELIIKDVNEQFTEAMKFIKQIPEHIKLIICPGNHEPMRIAEPQPRIGDRFGKELGELPNVTLVTNPALVNIHASPTFDGFDVLLYHGFSYSYYGDRVHSIRTSGKNVSERIELIMRHLLKRRHLAPTWGSNQFIPNPEYDPLVIAQIPDFFCSGHIHKSSFSNYRGVTLVSGSCFEGKSSYQEKFGHEPDPGKVPIVNLQTREGIALDFRQETL